MWEALSERRLGRRGMNDSSSVPNAGDVVVAATWKFLLPVQDRRAERASHIFVKNAV